MTDETTENQPYEITAYNAEGDELSLSVSREAPGRLLASTIFEAAGALASVPAGGWMHWDDGESERQPVAVIRLRHFEYARRSRGAATCTVHILEEIRRDI